MRVLLVAVLIPTLVLAQETDPACPNPEDARCASGGAPTGGSGAPSDVPVPSLPADSPIKTVPNAKGIGGLGGGGGGNGEAMLLVAVVALTVLPLVVYSFDAEAPPQLSARWQAVSGELRLLGGGTWTPDDVDGRSLLVPSGGVKGELGWNTIGLDASLRSSGDAAYAWDTHFLLRPQPKAHVQLALALGFRSVFFRGTRVNGFEAALPHEYTFWRSGPVQRFGLEVRPAILIGPPYIDLRIDAAFVIPVAGPVTARVGGNVYSFGHDVKGGFEAGLVAQF